MPKPGWQLKIVKGAYQKAYAFYHGEKLSEGARSITWSGGTLPDDEYDEFVVAGFIAGELAPDHRLYFPVTQDCEKGSARWTEIPAAGQDPHALKFPAPGVMLTARKAADAHASARTIKAGTLTIAAPWSRATPAGARTAAGYLKITNDGKEPDRLLSGTFAAAARGEVHEMAMVNDVMKMRELADGLEIKPSETVELKPGGYHMMFMELKAPLKAGQTVEGTLVFEKAGSVAVSYTVAPMGATGGGDHQH
jgi:copper(I)-binding protein